MKNLFIRTFVVALGVIAAGAVVAWTGPTGTAPANNTSAPINVTATTQTKTGILSSGDSFVAPNMTANQFCIGTSCVTSWGQAGGSGFTGSGTTNYLTKFTGATALGNSSIFDNGSVGIGTASPGQKLDVNGGWIKLTGTGSGGDSATRIGIYDSDNAGGVSGWWISQNQNGTFAIHQNSVGDRFIIDGSGNTTVSGSLTSSGQAVCLANGTNCPAAGAPAWASITGKPGNLGYWDTWYGSSYHASDGNMYLGYLGDWLSNRLNQAVTTGASPTFGTVTASAFIYSSDRRLKGDITPIQDALAKIVELNGVNFSWASGARAGQADVGVIAQEVQGVLPAAVHTDASGYLSVDYPKLVPLLIQAIKEQQAQIDALKADIDALRAGR